MIISGFSRVMVDLGCYWECSMDLDGSGYDSLVVTFRLQGKHGFLGGFKERTRLEEV